MNIKQKQKQESMTRKCQNHISQTNLWQPEEEILVHRHKNDTHYIDIVLIFFHILVLQEYWVLTESRIPRKPVLGGVRIIAFFISSHEQTQ